MNKEQKAATVEEIAAQIEAADAVFAVDYRGISVPGAAELRSRLSEADATFRIVKNSLTERAADQAGAEALRALLDGPTALTFVQGDAATAAKAISEFSRANDVLEFKGGLMDGEELTVDQIKSIARLPARDVLYAQLVGTVGSPLTGLVRGLNGLIAGFASQLQQIVDQGLLAAGEPEPAAEEEAPATEEAPAEEAPATEEAPAEEVPATEEAPAPEETVTESSADEAPEAEAAAAEEPAAEQPAPEPAEKPASEADASEAASAPETESDNQADASADADSEGDGDDADAEAKEEA